MRHRVQHRHRLPGEQQLPGQQRAVERTPVQDPVRDHARDAIPGLRTAPALIGWQTGLVIQTSARLLRLLSLLQSRRDWSGADLAGRLEVDVRTVRRDVDKLRQLGYPIHARTGTTGG